VALAIASMKKAFELLAYILVIIVAFVSIFFWWFLSVLCSKPRK
jgi:hypothetical protein